MANIRSGLGSGTMDMGGAYRPSIVSTGGTSGYGTGYNAWRNGELELAQERSDRYGNSNLESLDEAYSRALAMGYDPEMTEEEREYQTSFLPYRQQMQALAMIDPNARVGRASADFDANYENMLTRKDQRMASMGVNPSDPMYEDDPAVWAAARTGAMNRAYREGEEDRYRRQSALQPLYDRGLQTQANITSRRQGNIDRSVSALRGIADQYDNRETSWRNQLNYLNQPQSGGAVSISKFGGTGARKQGNNTTMGTFSPTQRSYSTASSRSGTGTGSGGTGSTGAMRGQVFTPNSQSAPSAMNQYAGSFGSSGYGNPYGGTV